MPKKKTPAAPRKMAKTSKRPIEQYQRPDNQRANNPQVGIVTAESDPWSNRLIAGDSLLVMNSLLEKEGMAGKVSGI